MSASKMTTATSVLTATIVLGAGLLAAIPSAQAIPTLYCEEHSNGNLYCVGVSGGCAGQYWFYGDGSEHRDDIACLPNQSQEQGCHPSLQGREESSVRAGHRVVMTSELSLGEACPVNDAVNGESHA